MMYTHALKQKLTIRSVSFIFLVVAGCAGKSDQSNAAQNSVDLLSEIKLTDLNNKPIELTEYKGTTIFINFWATWCRPCIQEMPSIAALQEQLAGKNIEFFFASDEEVEKIQKFMKSSNLNSNFVRVENPESIGIEALPTTFIFDGKGVLVFSEVGYKKWDDPAVIEMVTNLIDDHE